MARIKLSKHELARQRSQLRLFEKLLPSLDLKRQQLTAELKRAEAAAVAAQLAVDELDARSGEELKMLATEESRVDALLRLKDVQLGEDNIVGVRVPSLDGVEFEMAGYSRLSKPAWVDVLVDRLREAVEQRLRAQIAQERVRLLAIAVRRTTQRVNLFERVLIPDARDAIKRILIYLGDLERSAVANSKLAKAKIKRAQEVLHGAGP